MQWHNHARRSGHLCKEGYPVVDGSRRDTHLCLGAREAAEQYTLQNMVEKFVDGMKRCLELPLYH